MVDYISYLRLKGDEREVSKMAVVENTTYSKSAALITIYDQFTRNLGRLSKIQSENKRRYEIGPNR